MFELNANSIAQTNPGRQIVPTTVSFSPKTALLLDELKEYYDVKSTKSLVEKSIMIMSILAEEAGDSHKISLQGDGKDHPSILILK